MNENKFPQRTLAQNASLHLWLEQIAEVLNDAGFEKALTFGVDVPWTKETVKILFQKVAKHQFNKVHTSELTTKELTQVSETVNRFMGEQGTHVPFPSYKEVSYKQNPYEEG